jgi:hypothetical protein
MRTITMPTGRQVMGVGELSDTLYQRLAYADFVPALSQQLTPTGLLAAAVAAGLSRQGIDDTSILLMLKNLRDLLEDVAEQTHQDWLEDSDKPLRAEIVVLADHRYLTRPGRKDFMDLATLNYCEQLPFPAATTYTMYLAPLYIFWLRTLDAPS